MSSRPGGPPQHTRTLAPDGADATASARAGGQVPLVRTDLVGRDDQVADLLGAIRTDRLVSVVGPAGVGKTRLAAAVAAAAASDFPGGVYWVDLAGVDAAAPVDVATTRALGLRDVAGRDATHQVIEALGGRSVLIVLDNCEHVVDDVAGFADQIITTCPATVLLCTSREALAVEGEVVRPLAPLAVPRVGESDPEEIVRYPAVQLLLKRAASARPGFALTSGAALAAARVCCRLDGLPLSIELAAARLRVLTLQQVADALDDVFRLLVGGARRAPTRHQSLRAALDWSHALLGPDERVVLRRLAVFPATFSLAAAEDVTAAREDLPHVPRSFVLDVMSRLIDKSFLTVSHEGAQARYRMLYVVREYARELLQAAGETAATGDAHLVHYTELARAQAGLLGSAGAESALDRLDAELENLDAAVRHALDRGHPRALELGAALWRFCYLRGHYRQGREWLESLAGTGESVRESEGGGTENSGASGRRVEDRHEAVGERAAVLHGAGMLAFLECDYTQALRALEAGLGLHRGLGNRAGIAACLQALGGIAREQGRYQRSEELYQESLDLCLLDEDGPGAARARNYLAFLAWLQGDTHGAQALARQALDEVRGHGDHEGITWGLINLGCAALYAQDLPAARVALDEAAQIARLVAFREGQAWTDHLRGLLMLRQGEAEQAGALLRSALAGQLALGDRWRAASVYADLASVYAASDPRTAAMLIGRADALWEEIGSAAAPCERESQDATRAVVAARLGDVTYAQAWQDGRVAAGCLSVAGASSPSPRRGHRSAESATSGLLGRKPAVGGAADELTADSATLEIIALGGAWVQVGGRQLTTTDWGYGKPRELLFLLACSPPLTKDQIGLRLWPDLGPQQLRNALHTALRELRRALGDPGWVVFASGLYQLARGRPVQLDVTEFEQALATAGAAPRGEAALGHLSRGIELYAGDLLPSFDAEWVRVRREGLRRAFVAAVLQAGRLLAGLGRHPEAAEMFHLAVTQDPLLEVAHRELMLSWARAGEPARAARHYRDLESRLRAELGVSPAAETRNLFQRLTRPGDHDGAGRPGPR